MAEEQQANSGAAQDPQATPFAIQRIYCKDISFETPNTPSIFKTEWKPDIQQDIHTKTTKLEDSVVEVALTVTLTAKLGETTAFLCEVTQAGIFSISPEMPEQQRAHMLGAYIPNLLFPYAREAVSSLITRGTFPAFNLAPVNFDAVFAQYLQKRAQEMGQEGEGQRQLDA